MKDFDFDSLLKDTPSVDLSDQINYTSVTDLENAIQSGNLSDNDFEYKHETILFMLAYWDRKIQTKKRIENEKKIEQMFFEYGVNVRASKHALNQYLKSISKTDSDRKAEVQHNKLVQQISNQLDISVFEESKNEH